MGLFSTNNNDGLFGGSQSSGLFGGQVSSNYKISNLEDLKLIASQFGVKIEEPKPSLFQRTIDVLSRPTYASANLAKSLVTGQGNPLVEAWHGLSGEDKTTYSDVLQDVGVTNRWLKGGLGFALDVALDPTTYFGGAIMKGATGVAKGVAKPVVEVARKLNPAMVASFEVAGKSLKDAFGYALVGGYNTTAGLADNVYRFFNKSNIGKEQIIDDINNAFKQLPKEQHADFANTLLEHRKQIVGLEEGIRTQAVKKLEQTYGIKIANAREADIAIRHLEENVLNKVKDIRTQVDKTVKPFFAARQAAIKAGKTFTEAPSVVRFGTANFGDIDAINREIDLLKETLQTAPKAKITSKELMDLGGEITQDEVDATIHKIFTYEKERLLDKLDNLSQQLGKVKAGQPIVESMKKLTPAEYAVLAERKIVKLQNELADQTRVLQQVVDSRKIAKKQLNKMEPRFSTPEQKQFFDTTYKKLIDRTAEEAGIPLEERFAAYYPSIEKDLVQKGMPAGLKVGSKSYQELYRGLTKNAINNPVEALARTQYNIFRDNLADATLKQITKAYGLTEEEFKLLSRAEQAEWLPLRSKGAYGNIYGYLKKDDLNFIDNYMFPEFKTIDLLAKASGYDALTRLFKTAVTSWFPAFHVRNLMSGVLQNYQVLGAQALNPENIIDGLAVYKGADKALDFQAWSGTAKELNKVFRENFEGASRYISDIGKYVEELAGGSFNMKPMSKLNPRRLGNFVEGLQKTSAMVGALRQGHTIEQAVKLAEEAGFNYQKITKFEERIMRRAIPFYTFARKNAELQLKTLAKHPERIMAQIKLAKNIGNIFGGKVTEEDLQGLPDWALSGLGFKLSNGKYLTSFGLPLEEFVARINKPFQTTTSGLNPILKFPIESKLGYDFFREQKLMDIRSIDPTTAQIVMSPKSPEWLKEMFNIRVDTGKDGKVRYYASPGTLHKVRNLPTSRLQGTLEALSSDKTTVEKLLAFVSGAKIYDIDLELQKYFREKNLQQDIQDEMLMNNQGRTFNKFYVPK